MEITIYILKLKTRKMSSENFQMVDDLIKNIKMRNVLGVNSELDKS